MNRHARIGRIITLSISLLLTASGARAQLVEDVPDELQGVGIDPKLDTVLPLDLTFRTETGETVALGRYFEAGKPVVVNLVYFNCPMLCNVFLDGFVSSLEELAWTPGDEFEIVTVSIDPTETPAQATKKHDHFIEKLGRPEAAPGWHFLTGDEANIVKLADALGFSYRYDDKKNEYMHSAGLFLATPQGRLSRFLSGVMFEPQTLRLSLIEASDGKIGSAADQFLLYCFAYDHTAGRYGPAAFKIMRMFAALTVLLIAVFLMVNFRRDSLRKNPASLGVPS